MGEGQHTFLFADLAGFTALTEVHGDERAVELADDFRSAVRARRATGFRYEPWKRVTLEGIDEPVALYQITGAA